MTLSWLNYYDDDELVLVKDVGLQYRDQTCFSWVKGNIRQSKGGVKTNGKPRGFGVSRGTWRMKMY